MAELDKCIKCKYNQTKAREEVNQMLKKIAIGVGGLIVLIIIIATIAGGGEKKPPQQPQSTQAQDTKQEAPAKTLNYEVIQTWDIPNGGHGKVVIITRDYLNENDMAALCDKLRNDNKDDRNSFIYVYTDKKAAELRDKVLSDELTEAQRDFYDKNYVAQYNKNANSGLNSCAIYFDGVTGTNTKTIEY